MTSKEQPHHYHHYHHQRHRSASNPSPILRRIMLKRSPTRLLLAALLSFLLVTWAVNREVAGIGGLSRYLAAQFGELPKEKWEVAGAGDGRAVPLEVHIMSKCPDARDCLKDLVLPAMEEVSGKVDFKLSFIGKSVGDDEVECMHGETECQGNMIELCAAELYPRPEVYLGFTMCLTEQLQDIPKDSLLEVCALEHGLEISKLDACMSRDDGRHALKKLRASFERTKAAGVTKSCTVRLANEIRCVRDGGEWKECDGGRSKPKDLIADVKALYNNSSRSV